MKKDQLYNIQSKILTLIVKELVSGTNKTVILRKVKKEYSSKIADKTILRHLWAFSLYKLNNLSKYYKTRVKTAKNINEVMFKRVNLFVNDLSHEMNYVYYTMEDSRKKDHMDKLTSTGVFYLCSHHYDCAVDHKPYQGKIYISSFWEDRVDDEKTKRLIRAYIRNRGIKRIEWVLGKPIFMVMRRNCRHFFVRVPVDEVLSSSSKAMLKKRGIYSIKDRVETNREQYCMRYYRRYRTLIDLYKYLPCDKLLKDITRTERLIKKWGGK